MGPRALSDRQASPMHYNRMKSGYSRKAGITEGLRDLTGDFNLEATDSLGGKGWKVTLQWGPSEGRPPGFAGSLWNSHHHKSDVHQTQPGDG